MNANARVFILEGRLVRNPFLGQPYLAEARTMSLSVPQDYEDNRDIIRSATTPILISNRQHYQLMEEIITCILAHMPDLCYVLIETPRSYLNDLPSILLEPRVLLLDLATPLYRWLSERGSGEILIIHLDPRRRPKDDGANTIRLHLD